MEIETTIVWPFYLIDGKIVLANYVTSPLEGLYMYMRSPLLIDNKGGFIIQKLKDLKTEM